VRSCLLTAKQNIRDLQYAKVCAIMSPVQSIVCFNLMCPKRLIWGDRSATFKSQAPHMRRPVRNVLINRVTQPVARWCQHSPAQTVSIREWMVLSIHLSCDTVPLCYHTNRIYLNYVILITRRQIFQNYSMISKRPKGKLLSQILETEMWKNYIH
jgi:hypothetical protein